MRKRIAAILMALILFPGVCCAAADALYPFYDGKAYRLMDASGNMLDDAAYEYITDARLDDGQKRFIAFSSENGKSRATLLDEEGQPLTDNDYESIYYQSGAFMTIMDDMCGIIDENGNELLPARYTSIVPTGDGTFFTSTDDPFDGIADEIYLSYPDGRCRYLGVSGGLFGSFSEGLLCVPSRNGMYGYLNTRGEWVIAPVYDYAMDFVGGVAEVTRGGLCGLIDMSGNLILPIRYDSISASASDGAAKLIVTLLDDMATIYERKSMMPIATMDDVDYAFLPTSGTAMLVSEGYVQLYSISARGIVLELPQTNSLIVLSDESALVYDYDAARASIVDISNAHNNPIEFDGVTGAYPLFNDDTATAICVSRTVNGHTLWGVYALDGGEILPVKYDSVVQTCDNVFSVQSGDEHGLIRADGEWIFRVANDSESDDASAESSD